MHSPSARGSGSSFQSYNLFPHMTAAQNVMLAPRRVRGKDPGRVGRAGAGAVRALRPCRPDGPLPRPAVGRTAAARRDHPGARHVAPRSCFSTRSPRRSTRNWWVKVLDVLRQLRHEGMTMVLATHEMSFARELADTVCFLDGGRIIEQGPPEAIFTAPREGRGRGPSSSGCFRQRRFARGRSRGIALTSGPAILRNGPAHGPGSAVRHAPDRKTPPINL